MFKTTVLCVLLVMLVDIEAATTPNPLLNSFQKNINSFRKCLDQTLANSVNDINLEPVQPVFAALGDQINRFSKAYDDLTAKSTTTPSWLR